MLNYFYIKNEFDNKEKSVYLILIWDFFVLIL